MSRHACPICGDPGAYPLWIDREPPEGCPHDMQWHRGGPVSIKSVAECSYQRRKAEQQAEFRRVAPEAYDRTGNLLPGALAAVLLKYAHAYPDKPIVI